MKEFIRKYGVLCLVLLIFIMCKIPHLYYPYYWDESWPYMPAITQMYHHGVSLMPSAVDAELSRGHPLFFHAIAATWMNIFGASHLAMHSFALLISVLFLIAIYEAGLRLFNQRVAILALLLVAIQVVFFIQSSFVLFEMLIAFLGFLSLCFYVSGCYLLTAVCLTMLFYTKESGLMVGFVLGIDALISLSDKETGLVVKARKLLSVGVPCILIAIFFLIQKHIRGWYVFPLYSDIIEHRWNMLWYQFRMGSVYVTFYSGFRFWYFILLMLLAVIAAIKNKTIKYLILLLPATAIYYFVDDKRAGRIMPGIPFFIVFILITACFLYIYTRPEFFARYKQRKFILLAGAFIFCFLCFSATNFFSYRYFLITIVPLLFITAAFFDTLLAQSYKALYIPVVILVLVIECCSFIENDSWGDCDLGAYNGMAVEQGIVNYMEQNNLYDKTIGTGSFLEQEHLLDPATGYLHGNRAFPDVKWFIEANTAYAIFTDLEADTRYEKVKNDTSFHLVYRIAKGKVWGEVYARRK